MPRKRFSLPTPTTLKELSVAVNEQLNAIAEDLARIEGLDSKSPSFAANVEFNHHRVMGVRDPEDEEDAVPLGYLRRYVASGGAIDQAVTVISGGGSGSGVTIINPVFTDVTASRALETVYQNTASTAMIVQISVTLSA